MKTPIHGSYGWYDRSREKDNERRRKVLCCVKGCQSQGRFKLEGAFGTRRFCQKHHRIWRVHNEIVSRICALPAI